MPDDVPVVASMRLPDGRTFDYRTDWPHESAASLLDMWTEGNYSCDCNRSLFLNDQFRLALGGFDNDLGVPCLPCGETIALVAESERRGCARAGTVGLSHYRRSLRENTDGRTTAGR